MAHSYELVREYRGLQMYERDDGKFCVVSYSRTHGQFYSFMPGDCPPGGGQWYARATDAGLDYVACGYSRGYAARKFREFVLEIS